MITLSLSEIGALCTKAARGAGYSWGMAQEAGFAAKWLCAHGHSGAVHIAGLLETVDGKDLSNLAPGFDDTGIYPAEVETCSLALGCLISDLPQAIGEERLIEFRAIIEPLILAPFLSLTLLPTEEVVLQFSDTSATITCDGLHISGAGFPKANTANISISRPQKETARQTPTIQPALSVEQGILAILEGFAARTYVPESELSREKGAGGAD